MWPFRKSKVNSWRSGTVLCFALLPIHSSDWQESQRLNSYWSDIGGRLVKFHQWNFETNCIKHILSFLVLVTACGLGQFENLVKMWVWKKKKDHVNLPKIAHHMYVNVYVCAFEHRHKSPEQQLSQNTENFLRITYFQCIFLCKTLKSPFIKLVFDMTMTICMHIFSHPLH